MVVRIWGLTRGEEESPREITRNSLLSDGGGENGWLIRFLDSAFFCEWIAVSYLYKHDHPGVRDYLCNRMYTLPLSGVESYLFQICYMLVHKPSPSLDKFVIDICSKSLKIALKVQWFLMAESEGSDDKKGISRIQEKCQIAATLIGEWAPLIRPQSESTSNVGKNQGLNRCLSSKQRLPRKSFSFSHSFENPLQDEGTSKVTPEENNMFKRSIPGPKVQQALLFRKSVDKVDEESDDEDFFKRLIRDYKDNGESEMDGFFKIFLRDSKDEDVGKSKEGDDENKKDGLQDSKDNEESKEDGFFKRLLGDSKDEDVGKSMDKNGDEDRGLKSVEDDEKEGFSRKIFKEKFDDKKDVPAADDDDDDEEYKVDANGVAEMPSESNNDCGRDSSPGTENFIPKLFRDRDPSVDDSEIFVSKNKEDMSAKVSLLYSKVIIIFLWQKHPSSLKHRNDKSNPKPPLPTMTAPQSRKGTYHESLDFVRSLCEISYGLVDVFPVEDRQRALCEVVLASIFLLNQSLSEINEHVVAAQSSGGVCFPMGRGIYRVVHIPEDEAILLNSREKAPYLICIEVLKSETSSMKDGSGSQNSSKGGGIPLANGDTHLAKPPPWAYPLPNRQDFYPNGYDRMQRSTSQEIDEAISQLWESKPKFVDVSLSVEDIAMNHRQKVSNPEFDTRCCQSKDCETYECRPEDGSDLEWVRVVLRADSGVSMDDIEEVQEEPRRREHRRVPSMIAFEEVKAAALKGETPPGLSPKRTGQDLTDVQRKDIDGGSPKEGDALSAELWEAKKDRIRQASVYGKLPGWDLCSVIVKSGDDCRQEHLAVQLISHFYDIFQEAGLPLWLRPYEVLVTSSYTALIETIPDTASLHSIKSRYPDIESLRDFFVAKYQENSPSYKLSQRNFAESMAGYSLVCYLLQVKDRHNGNLLLDEEGHVIHIDFGFMLSNSPGGVNFESAPFKLTRELLEVMDSDAEGVSSEFFDYFKVLKFCHVYVGIFSCLWCLSDLCLQVLCIQGFLTCRKHADRIILLVEMLQESGFPCFKSGPRTVENLRKRFHLSLTEEIVMLDDDLAILLQQCVSLVLSLISSSLDAWRTRQYDYYQRVLNGIL
ncbi:hypothetical protein OSB04_000787 [Centaurea solstitialis]|uniref:1-phosphatidylinositol 4-kinase n=1 Tax=Centaurea solstitialis TaxID=347529 RepID=A0AA38U0C0_9ASTR|nr:hypothetical protein OSB04_000787 [Centaurea solstitialis]